MFFLLYLFSHGILCLLVLLCIYLCMLKHFSPFNSMFWMFSLYVIMSVTACNVTVQSPLSSCQNVTANLYCVGNNFLPFSLLISFSPTFCPTFVLFSVLFHTLPMPFSNSLYHPLLHLSVLSHLPLPSSSLYQPPRRRPSAVWSPCAATNMGRAAVPAWPTSWSKWPGSARPAPTIATRPATGGEDNNDNKWFWILMNPLHLLVAKIWAARLKVSAHDVATTLL